MPKIVTHSLIVTDRKRPDELPTKLFSYRCLCSSLALVLDTPLSSLPTRKFDGARVIDTATINYQSLATDGTVLKVQRAQARTEVRQYHQCSTCKLPLFYRGYPPAANQFMYIIKGALHRNVRTRDKHSKSPPDLVQDGDESADLHEIARHYEANPALVQTALGRDKRSAPASSPENESNGHGRIKAPRRGTLLR